MCAARVQAQSRLGRTGFLSHQCLGGLRSLVSGGENLRGQVMTENAGESIGVLRRRSSTRQNRVFINLLKSR